MLNEEKSMSEASSSSPSLNNGHDDLDLDGDDTFAVNLDRSDIVQNVHIQIVCVLCFKILIV